MNENNKYSKYFFNNNLYKESINNDENAISGLKEI